MRKYYAAMTMAILGLALMTSSASGDIQVTWDRVAGNYYNNGGEFVLTTVTGHGPFPLGTSSITTFCVEREEYVNSGWTYKAEVNTGGKLGWSTAIKNNSEIAHGYLEAYGGDPLDPRTAYLYTGFLYGTLTTGYNVGTTYTHAEFAGGLQAAIWRIEQEVGSTYDGVVSGNALTLANLYWTEANNAKWTTLGNIRVLNLYHNTDSALAQDQLVEVPPGTPGGFPVPGALVLGAIGLGLVGWMKRRLA